MLIEKIKVNGIEYKYVPISSLKNLGVSEEESKKIIFEYEKNNEKNNFLNNFEKIRSALSDNASATRLASWNAKETRARRVLNNTATKEDKEQLQIEANLRQKNETIQELAQRQVFLSDSLTNAIATIDGLEKQIIEKLELLDNSEDLQKFIKEQKEKIKKEIEQFKNFGDL